jgi:hypothetical protein
MWSAYVILKKLPKVNDHPLGEFSHNLVTLAMTLKSLSGSGKLELGTTLQGIRLLQFIDPYRVHLSYGRTQTWGGKKLSKYFFQSRFSVSAFC